MGVERGMGRKPLDIGELEELGVPHTLRGPCLGCRVQGRTSWGAEKARAGTEFFRNFWAQERGTKVGVLGTDIEGVGGASLFLGSGGCQGLPGWREKRG